MRGRLVIALGLATACPSDEEAVAPFFPEDYAYTEVRDCRGSGDHDLHNIRILADAAALAPYQSRTEPFPEGAVVLKEEYDFADEMCAGEIVQWTVMQRTAELDWAWQRVDPDRVVVEEDPPRCIGCHQGCGVPPDGYEGTCAIP